MSLLDIFRAKPKTRSASREELEQQVIDALAAREAADAAVDAARVALDAATTGHELAEADKRLAEAEATAASADRLVQRAERLLADREAEDAKAARARLEAERARLEDELSRESQLKALDPLVDEEADLIVKLADVRARRIDLAKHYDAKASELKRVVRELEGERPEGPYMDEMGCMRISAPALPSSSAVLTSPTPVRERLESLELSKPIRDLVEEILLQHHL